MNKRVFAVGAVALASVAVLAGCRSNGSNGSTTGKAKTDLKVAIITDTGGINDRSFNQSAWEGLEAWGKENNLSKGNGFNYYQSNSASDYTTNFNSAEAAGYKLQVGIGFSLEQATEEAAKNNPKTEYLIIDSAPTAPIKNLASALFADNEGAYLAGVAAAKASKTGKIGFIGGMQSDVITRFQVGYEAGAKSVNPNIKVDVQYAQSFTDAAKGKTIAHAMYGAGEDVVYQCAGGVGVGAFNEAKAQNEGRTEANKVWLIGVDQDQKYLGGYTSKDGKKSNFVLVSTIKEVGKVVRDMADKAKDNKFPGGTTTTYDLKNGGVNLGLDNVTPEIKTAVDAAKADIISGKITVPSK
ncbi:BMP family lipoprotein [Lactococcus fujiensis]|uniref:Basic membrane lipoprotein n=1 Tax=Lactococcus fujiensis JCM 16395 TaxID=1291764 RepID=A0A2A5RIZ2_9LACT|nr:BMP family protein [Lactococcus fujiensis]PCR99066.1 basic membrane lipoprotein [Lactococcus fujiensis JCM 16395]